MRTIQLCYRAV